jgi:tRNA(Ile)-lysidine synthase
MNLNLSKGVYVVAVSGGVDSVVLLDMLVKNQNDSTLIVAHFDHGIREDSNDDDYFVKQLAAKYGLDFVHAKGNLGENASEDTARTARYRFLFDVVKRYKADGLFTAHHQDDLIETALINILRGTNRRGLSSLRSNEHILRPLLNKTKESLVEYAKENNLTWHEDSTNQEVKYLRNYIRLKVFTKLSDKNRQKIVAQIKRQMELNDQIDENLDQLVSLNIDNGEIPRLWLACLEPKIINEVIAYWFRLNGVLNYSQSTLKRLNTELRVAKANSLIDATSGWQINVGKDNLALKPLER